MIRYGSSKFWNRQAEEKLGTPQALIWCKDPPEGARGAGFVGGHYHRNWAIDDYRTLILNTIAWVSGVEVPKGGVPSLPISLKNLTKILIGRIIPKSFNYQLWTYSNKNPHPCLFLVKMGEWLLERRKIRVSLYLTNKNSPFYFSKLIKSSWD